MKIKKGFTIAELLLTLTVIGVLAALTTPILVSSINERKAIATLAKLDNTLSNAIERMMLDNAIEQITPDNLAQCMGLLANYIESTPFDNDEEIIIRNPAGNHEETIKNDHFNFNDEHSRLFDCIMGSSTCEGVRDWNGDGIYNVTDLNTLVDWALAHGRNIEVTAYGMNNNTTMVVANRFNNPEISVGEYRGIVADIIVDVDGNKNNNIVGRDVFGFVLDRSGALIPANSQAHRMIGQPGSKYIGEANTECSTDPKAGLQNLFACTGRIADNGWKK